MMVARSRSVRNKAHVGGAHGAAWLWLTAPIAILLAVAAGSDYS
jgi:hypothetical protein